MNEKKLRHRYRKALMKYLNREWRKCFWTWPWGHHWRSIGGMVTTNSTDPDRVTRCTDCGKPIRLESFDIYGLERLVERVVAKHHPDLPDDQAYATVLPERLVQAGESFHGISA